MKQLGPIHPTLESGLHCQAPQIQCHKQQMRQYGAINHRQELDRKATPINHKGLRGQHLPLNHLHLKQRLLHLIFFHITHQTTSFSLGLFIMSITRQSLHILRRSVAAPENAACNDNLPTINSTIFRVPNALPQLTQ